MEVARVVFFDFDECVRGHPAQDLASFVVDLHFYRWRYDRIHDIARRLLAAYRQRAPWAVSDAEWLWFARLQFLNKAYRYFLQQRPRALACFGRLRVCADRLERGFGTTLVD